MPTSWEPVGPVAPAAARGGAAGSHAVGAFLVTKSKPELKLEAFPDTLRFIDMLSRLDDPPVAGSQELPERAAARGLFRWEDEVYVARAPGRLDVMGGIADYSGSLVLQLPLAQACHVAVQRHAPHMHSRLQQQPQEQQRAGSTPGSSPVPSTFADPDSPTGTHSSAGTPPTPLAPGAPSSATTPSVGSGSPAAGGLPPPHLRVVSLHAEEMHRGPVFEMDLSDLLHPATAQPAEPAAAGEGAGRGAAVTAGSPEAAEAGGQHQQQPQPVSYAQAREYFNQDPAVSWAAYVAGALLVLMKECGLQLRDSLSILVSSDVPEGKGVSSSAAVEVATMSALVAAFGLEGQVQGRRLALLCQVVENEVVGAPCGVMDQMAATLGREGCLLALRCQPAEVEGEVALPPHLRFWGIDSGIRHSVGGSDYGAVRVGTFMGRRICSQLAHERQQQRQPRQQQQQAPQAGFAASGAADEALDGPGKGAAGAAVQPIGGGYLANVDPSTFTSLYEQHLPLTISGRQFTNAYGSHWDRITAVDPQQTYAVRVPTGHPVHEHFRVRAFRQILSGSGTASPAASAGCAAAAAGSSSAQGSGGSCPKQHGSSITDLCSSSGSTTEQLAVLGELMYQSHASYSACGLASPGTDRIVELVREEQAAALAQGRQPGLLGAKITGGGCGGTVCVLGRADEAGEAAFQRVVARYAAEAGRLPNVFEGSSSGAAAFGHLHLQLK